MLFDQKIMLKRADWQKLILSFGLMAASVVILCYYFYFGQEGMVWVASPGKDSFLKITQFTHWSKLNGVGVLEMEEESPKVVGVMLDGHFDALPIKGVNEAAIIYEAPVEGVTTRFLAIYPAGQAVVSEVGPIRSARPYFLDWLAEYGDALYMHCGGSPEALDLIKERKIFDANEFYWGGYYWRDHGRTAPYNLFTASWQWNSIFEKYVEKHPGWSWEGWKFSSELVVSSSTESVTEIKIRYGRGFEVAWKYNDGNRNYERWLNGEKMSDVEGQAIIADNILVQYVSMITLDDIGRRKIETIGEGEARIFQGGQMLRGIWKKDGRPERTKFYIKAGAEISLIPGKIWVMIVPENLSIEISI